MFLPFRCILLHAAIFYCKSYFQCQTVIMQADQVFNIKRNFKVTHVYVGQKYVLMKLGPGFFLSVIKNIRQLDFYTVIKYEAAIEYDAGLLNFITLIFVVTSFPFLPIFARYTDCFLFRLDF